MPWYGFGFSAAILAASAAILEKWLLKRMSVWQMSAWFSLATAFLVIPILAGYEGSLRSLRPELYGVLLLKSVLEAVQFVSVMMGIRRLGISTTVPLMALSPGFVALAATLVIGDALTLPQWGGLLLMVAGMYLVQLEGDSAWWRPFFRLFTDRDQWVILVALTASVAVALLDKTILSGYRISPRLFITVQQWILAALFLVTLAARSALGRERPLPWNGKVALGLAALAVVTVGYRYLQMRGVMLAPVALVLAVRRTAVVMAALVGGSLFHERGFLRRSLAAAILAGGAIVLSQNV
jgi:drug/metabolite transporter (DMT)-like permease